MDSYIEEMRVVLQLPDADFALTGLELMHALCDSLEEEDLVEFLAFTAWHCEHASAIGKLIRRIEEEIDAISDKATVSLVAKYLRENMCDQDLLLLQELLI